MKSVSPFLGVHTGMTGASIYMTVHYTLIKPECRPQGKRASWKVLGYVTGATKAYSGDWRFYCEGVTDEAVRSGIIAWMISLLSEDHQAEATAKFATDKLNYKPPVMSWSTREDIDDDMYQAVKYAIQS